VFVNRCFLGQDPDPNIRDHFRRFAGYYMKGCRAGG
jgi:hypothetical protein